MTGIATQGPPKTALERAASQLPVGWAYINSRASIDADDMSMISWRGRHAVRDLPQRTVPQ
jgi:hypothetical protein